MLTVGDSGVQLAGQTSPWVSTNWKALTRRRVSSTERPTGRSFTLMCFTTPWGSMRNRPLEEHTTTINIDKQKFFVEKKSTKKVYCIYIFLTMTKIYIYRKKIYIIYKNIYKYIKVTSFYRNMFILLQTTSETILNITFPPSKREQVKGDVLYHQVWVWLDLTSCFENLRPPRCVLDRSVH